ncbi:autotransporter outer membrane beta-barrel domain-containing protein [Roseibium sp. Sym1]|uniref:autotransporter outer membrane beta-barrel domain-containing protein n=1 Tax=Roseibium sp. Sym1 TaxID=3016006 RepID=UPI0022B50EA6|nr:autotransporter outer membrane beta-barrel domain-containing protein [Roseibium sp. Sym1]
MLLTTVSVACLTSLQTALADDCVEDSVSITCDFTEPNSADNIFYQAAGTQPDGDGKDISITNSAPQQANLPTSFGDAFNFSVWYMQTRGNPGVDSGPGQDGGDITIQNNNGFLISVDQPGSSVTGPVTGVSADSIGGNGDLSNDDNNSNGGDGGDGGDISVTLDNAYNSDFSYSVSGSSANGFKLISIGSYGGKGGDQNNALFDDQHGGSGGDGGSVRIENSSDSPFQIGSSSSRYTSAGTGGGLIASSTGGGGGWKNGDAGSGGTVVITNETAGAIYWQTTDIEGTGLFALAGYSLGGNGYLSSDYSDNGGDGGAAGDVTVRNHAHLLLDVAGSNHEASAAVLAKSTGGNGGTGPLEDSSGGNGGQAGDVTIEISDGGSVLTRGNEVFGVVGQSIGGNGGDGGDGTALAGTGGGGGFGGDAGDVTFELEFDLGDDSGLALVETTGDYSSAVVAQSIGGGGGTGGDFVSVLGGQSGNGGNGGNAGDVLAHVHTDGSFPLTTAGDHAFGVVAQSIAGSGGAGGANTSTIASLGGDGAGGGTVGNATVNARGHYSTQGFNAHAFVVQSIGGGGGAAGSATGLVSVGGNSSGSTKSDGAGAGFSNTGTIVTSGDASVAAVVQSIGGGGGSGGDAAGIAGVGGKGAGGGNGGAVAVSNIGELQTSGDWSAAAIFQSVGGGGGNGGGSTTLSSIASIGVGGAAAGGGDGGTVCVDNTATCGATGSNNAFVPYVPDLEDPDNDDDGWGAIVTAGDFAPGMIAQSVGGGGGTGGSAKNFSSSSYVALQTGGMGGAGGRGGDVTIRQRNLSVSTAGAQSNGVIAQSIGGGGGTGGNASYRNASVGFNAALIVGGSGGVGGDGKSVTVDLTGSNIVTGLAAQSTGGSAPGDSIGILAQSVGAGGGSGGSASASDFLVAVPTGTGVPVAFNFQSAVGGNGGNAGNGGAVSVSFDKDSALTTIGDASHGILAQSIGGGGGRGGDASTLTTTLGDKDTVEVTAGTALGGGAGNIMHDINNNYDFVTSGGGNGATVTVELGTYGAESNSSDTSASKLTTAAPGGTLLTVGDNAHGVLAQSIGGGGGDGGIGNSDTYSQGGVASVDAKIELGGKGGAGGSGGRVSVHNYAGYTVQTQGSGSNGLVAQSIGGGGGNSQGGTLYLAASSEGYSGTVDVGVGATGGSGGDGGSIYVEQYGVVETFGGDADGVVLQSIGGGGGIGGSLGNDASSHKILDFVSNAEADIQRLTDAGSSYELTVDVGGKGGSGGSGNTAQYYHDGRITTYGAWADGVVVQSIGGGGGQGGTSVAAPSNITANIQVSVGGKGGSGGDGGEAAIWVRGSDSNAITTHGYGAFGMLLQSIGGGGGQAGDGSNSLAGSIAIGGDGGGTGGAGGDGGHVYTYDSSNIVISTAGADAFGFVAQSIGGGGGQGGVGSSEQATKVSSSEFSVSIGGKGGVAGNGGEIDLDFDASISTHGRRASGILLQSIGGGGGLGVTGTVPQDTDLAIGGTGGAAGDGGVVTLDLLGGNGILTSGSGAHGIIAQSIGGGGGLGGDPTGGLLTIRDGEGEAASGGASGDGGTVTLNIDAPIITTGSEAFGVIVQSIGGGGGYGGTASGAFAGVTSSDGMGTGGDINLTVGNTIETIGPQSTAVFAQSQGPDGNGQIGITVESGGTISGGVHDDTSAIWVAGGRDNSVVLSGDAVVQSGAYLTGIAYDNNNAVLFNGSGTTAEGATLDVTVNGSASLYGDVLLTNDDGNTAGTVTNNSSNTLAGGYLYGAHVVNNGRFVLNREDSTGTTEVTGNFEQTSQGELYVSVDLNNTQSDLLDIGGDATLAGTLGVNAISLLPERQTRFLTVGGTVAGTLAAKDSLLFDYAIGTSGNDHYFSVGSADFTPEGVVMTSDQTELAGHLQQIWNAGGNEEFGILFGAFANAVDNSSGSYTQLLDEFRPKAALAPAVEQGFQSLAFSNSLMSCPVFEGGNALLSEGSCVWARTAAGTGSRFADGNAPSYNFDALTYSMGAQKEISPGWFVGGAAALHQSWLSQSSSNVSGEGLSGFAGVSLKHEIGDWTLAGAVSGGYGSYDIDRRISLAGISETVSSSPDVFSGGIRARIARSFAATSFYAKPYVDLDAVYTHVDGHRESGTYGLRYEGSGDWNFAASPSLEIGSRYTYPNGTDLRFFGRVGMTFLTEDTRETTARFTSAPAGTGMFKTSLEHEDKFASVGAGVQVSSKSGFDLRFEYDGNFSDRLATNSGSIRLSIPF